MVKDLRPRAHKILSLYCAILVRRVPNLELGALGGSLAATVSQKGFSASICLGKGRKVFMNRQSR